MANAASHWYTNNYPDIALWLNPANSEARIRKIEQTSEKQAENSDIPALIDSTLEGLYYESYNPKLYSMLGLLQESAGVPASQTQALFKHALTLNGADIRALLRRFAYTASNGEIEEAVRLAEVIYRGWPTRRELVEPYLPALLSSDTGYRVARKRFAELPKGPTLILASLTKSNAGLYIARKLLLDWHHDGIGDLRSSINLVVNSLISQKQYNEAFLLNGLTLDDKEKEASGYIFDGNFNLEPNGSPFNWQLPKISGVSINTRSVPAASNSGNGDDNRRALEIRFLNTPVRLSARLQLLRLPPSRLDWTLVYSTRNLKGSKPVELKIQCFQSTRVLASLILPPTAGETTKAETRLQVPVGACPLQEIIITNNNTVESWQNRYSGSVFLHQTEMKLDQE